MYRAKLFKIFLFSFLISLCFISFSFGGTTPQLINYQGTLTNTDGTPVPDGQYAVVFNIYDVSTVGTPLWTETWNLSTTPIVTGNGNFNAMLGTHNPIPISFFNDHPTAYLGIKVGNDSEMLPRQRISSVAYAFTAGTGVPKGAIIMWSGAIDQIPEGWALCDGTNGTPDLRDRFVIGAGSGYAVAATGGEATHILTVSEMSSHTHIQNAHTHVQNAHNHNNGIYQYLLKSDGIETNSDTDSTAGEPNIKRMGAIKSATATNQNATATNQNTGGGAAHNNMPPYYALAFIMKL